MESKTQNSEYRGSMKKKQFDQATSRKVLKMIENWKIGDKICYKKS